MTSLKEQYKAMYSKKRQQGKTMFYLDQIMQITVFDNETAKMKIDKNFKWGALRQKNKLHENLLPRK